VAAIEGRPGDRLLQSRILYRLGVAHSDLSNPRGAADAYARALAIQLELLGDAHPTVARTLMNRADALIDLGLSEEATADMKRVRTIYETTVGPRTPLVADADINLASNLIDTGDAAAAIAPARSAVEIYDETLGPESSKAGWGRGMLATALSKAGQRDEAEREFTRALAIVSKVSGPTGRQAQAIRLQLASHVRRAGDPRRAHALAVELVRDAEKDAGPTSATLVDPLLEVGEAAMLLQKPADAVAALERALAIQTAAPRGPYDQARLALALAHALRATGGDPARVQALATEAKTGFTAAGKRGAQGVAEADALVQSAPPRVR
jgi:tetratricopeptide (TPR) repeat protein